MEVAARLAGAVQDGDLVARLGGDEFAVLFIGLPAPAAAASRAHAVLAALTPPIDIDGLRIDIEASGGAAVAPHSGGVDELLRRADVAMYHAKRYGQRLAKYASARDTALVGALTLGGDLARAVAEREFTVNFQPIVDLGTGEALSAALQPRHWPVSVHRPVPDGSCSVYVYVCVCGDPLNNNDVSGACPCAIPPAIVTHLPVPVPAHYADG